MTKNINVLERLRLWKQINTIVDELQDLIYEWYRNDPAVENLDDRLCRVPSPQLQLNLPSINAYQLPEPVKKKCRLCLIRKWP